MKNLLTMMELSQKDIFAILDLADQLKYERQHNIPHEKIEGKSIGLIFKKISTRTRVSFESGAYQLGIQSQFLSSKDLQVLRGEPVKDTARTLSRYLDAVMIRTYDHSTLEEFVENGSIPVINGLTDFAHPCQILADLMTIKEKHGALEGLNVAYIGDGDNVCNSLIAGCLIMGMNISVATPIGYEPHEKVLEFAKNYPNQFTLGNDPKEAVKDADVVVTDAWVSMGKEDERDVRMEAFKGFTLNDELLSLAKEDAMVQHCLPAYRGQEITEEVFEAHADEIFEEAENRLHVQKAVMVLLMKDDE